MTLPEPETCFNCSFVVSKCKCGDTETYRDEDGPACPYCGNVIPAWDTDGVLYDESTSEYECDECEQEFKVSVYQSFSWTCKRKEGEDG